MADPVASSHRRLVLRGLAWTSVYRVFEALVSFAAMLVLVRVIPPEEYGRAGVVVGLVTLLNAFGCSMFMSQALQLAGDSEPDWSLHWSAGLYIQGFLGGVCQLIGGVCWMSPTYRPIAPLVHLAGLGILLDWPNWLGGIMLRRAMDFGRLQILNGVATLSSLTVTLALALGGGGAYAIVLGSNVARALPFGLDLLIVRRWRPDSGWWRWPDWGAYRAAAHFGLRQVGSALVHAASGALEAAVLPGAVGYAAIGLFSRAQALFATTVGRLGDIVVETVYPLMPRYAATPGAYPRQATLFVQIVFLLALPGAVYVGIEGPVLSRLLYGERWIAADPLILPAALIGVGHLLFLTGSSVLLAANRLTTCLVLDVAAAGVAAPLVLVALTSGGLLAYAWALAMAQLLVAAVGVGAAAPLLTRGWIRVVVAPPLVSTAAGAVAVGALSELWASHAAVVGLLASAGVYVLVVSLSLRYVFPGSLAAVLSRLPGGARIHGWLGLAPPLVGAP